MALETQKVHKHDTLRQFGLVIETIKLAAVLENDSEGNNVVEIQCRVNMVDKRLHILLGALKGTTRVEHGCRTTGKFPGSIRLARL
jgi:hypothetical protein